MESTLKRLSIEGIAPNWVKNKNESNNNADRLVGETSCESEMNFWSVNISL